ncbi:MAG TPA: cation diffusion facilitator family transporter [Acidobacteriaceae bacterium]|jgi:cation diffusion facilitator family transporter
MSPPDEPTGTTQTGRAVVKQKRVAALMSMLAACGMTALKLIAGLLTGSLGMLSDAAHSGLDLLGAALTFASVRISDKPADEDHPYGHARVETLSAFTETFLMGASCVWIVVEAIIRIFVAPVTVRPSVWPFAVLALSITVDLSRSRALKHVAAVSGSQALEADALHFASDIWSSAAVALGLAASYAGVHFGIAWLRYADPLAALVVSAVILHFAWGLARRTTYELLDTAPAGAQQRIARAVERIEGVVDLERVRVRRSGNRVFADLRVAVPRFDTAEHIEVLVQRITAAVKAVVPGIDATVRTIPRQVLGENIFDRIRGVAALNNVTLHDLSVEQEKGGLHVEQHIEVAESLPLVEAHRFVCELEEQMYRAAPEVSNVLTHIESEPATIEASATLEHDRRLEEDLRAAARTLPEIIDIHEVAVSRMGDRLHLSCHCTLPDALPMHRVHDVITSLEDRLKLERPEVYRMLVHPEPETDNRHERRSCNRAANVNSPEEKNDRESGMAARSGLRSHIG